jgi:hypothetical protein
MFSQSDQPSQFVNVFIWLPLRSRESAICIATTDKLYGWGVGVQVEVGATFSPLHLEQTGSGAHPAFYKMGAGVTRWKVAGAIPIEVTVLQFT